LTNREPAGDWRILMEISNKDIAEYRNQLKNSNLKAAYQGIMKYFDHLRLHLKSKQPEYFISDVHYGLLDYTYLYFFPKSLQRQKLKVALLFSHDTFKLEVLLAGYNRSAQAKYWKLFKENGFSKYNLAKSASEPDRFLDHTISDNPDFSNLNALTQQVESDILSFIHDIEAFLTKNKSN
jgi:hypothetical protein